MYSQNKFMINSTLFLTDYLQVRRTHILIIIIVMIMMRIPVLLLVLMLIIMQLSQILAEILSVLLIIRVATTIMAKHRLISGLKVVMLKLAVQLLVDSSRSTLILPAHN